MRIKRTIGISAIVIGAIGLLAFSWIWFAPCALGGCAPLDELAAYQAEGSELLDIAGQPFARLATVNRRIVSIDSLPEYLSQAVISIEDRRFYDHGGVDIRRTIGALVSNVRAGGVAEGGSTITQQLARNLFPEWLPYQERNLRRKILEARVARQIERTFDKDKILELYLNHIYLGSGAYGIEAASEAYFDKPASALTLMEAATLAGVPQSPSQINPKENIERATARRDLVLDQMVEAGYISTNEAATAKAEPIVVTEGDASTEGGPEGSYFVERVRRELEETVGSRFYTAGLSIHTTLDSGIQSAAEEELARQLDAIESGSFGTYRHATYPADEDATTAPEYLQGAVVVIDASTGEVRALVGGRDFADSKFDRATQALRQPGSAFKPFVYAAALERYRTPSYTVEDTPIRVTLAGGQVWEPRNYTDEYDGLITLREALSRSKNTATVRVAEDIGMGSVIRTARELGITSDIPDLPSTALGAAEVRPIEIIAAYAAFANGGDRVQPHLIRKVTDRNGRVLWEARPERESVLDPAVAFVLTTILQDAIGGGTGTAVRAVGFQGEAAGKTGTTNDASDAWFIGYTPELVAGVWLGLDNPQTIVRGASGGTLAAPVWGRLMQRVYADRPTPTPWQPPSGVTTAVVDRVTGAAVSDFCPPQGPTYTEYFIRSSPPPQSCPQYDVVPRYTYSDSLWIDEEWSDFDYEYPVTPGSSDSGVDWPELEALRRRMDRDRALRDGRNYDPTLRGAQLPPGTDDAGVIFQNEPIGQPGQQPAGGVPGQPPIGGQPNVGGQPDFGADPPAPAQPEPTPPSDPVPAAPVEPEPDGPRLLGTPVTGPS